MDTLLHTPTSYLIGAAVWTLSGIVSLFLLLTQLRRRRLLHRRLNLVRAGLSIWCLLAALTLCEFAFAVWYDQTDSIMETNASKRWMHIHVRYNRNGFRDDVERNASQPQHDRRSIVFAGDSFTFGHGIRNVEDRFSNLVRSKLNLQTSGTCDVSNIGLPGATIDKIIKVVHRQLRAGLSADTVVYVYCLNDIERLNPELADSLFYEIGRRRPTSFLFRDTYFFNFLYFRFWQYQLPVLRNYYGFVDELYRSEQHFDTLRSKITRFRNICSSYGADLRIAVFPFVHNIGPEYPFLEAHEKLVEFCHSELIPVLDLEPVLSPYSPGILVVNPYDAHPNEFANQLVADAMLARDSQFLAVHDTPVP